MNSFHIFNFIIGCCLASHAGVISDRFYKANFIWARSKCSHCLSPLKLTEQIPLLSYLFLRGRCHNCHAQIPSSLFIIEVSGGLSLLFINLSSIGGQVTAALLLSLLAASYSDLKSKSFPTLFLLPISYLALWRYQLFPFPLEIKSFISLTACSLLLLYLVIKKQLGSGDLCFYWALFGAFGPQASLNCLLLGALTALLLAVFTPSGQNDAIPFLPYLYFALLIQISA